MSTNPIEQALQSAMLDKHRRITIDVDLETMQVGIRMDKPLAALVTADILIQAASGVLKEAIKQESMLVGRGKAPGIIEDLQKGGETDNDKTDDNNN